MRLHTALGDAEWALAIYDHITGFDVVDGRAVR